MKKYLVTGAAGVIGYEITKQLLERGDTVVSVDKYLKGGKEDLVKLHDKYKDKFKVVEADLVDNQWREHVSDSFDGIFHMAAIVGVKFVNENPYTTVHDNVMSTFNVFNFAKEIKCKKVIFASSSENYACGITEGHVDLPTNENVTLSISDITLPRWSYAASKICGESGAFGLTENYGIDTAVIRFHNVYGPRMTLTHVIPEMIERCKKEVSPFPLYGHDQTRSFLHVSDAATAVLLIEKIIKGSDIYNVGSEKEVSILGLAETIFEQSRFRPAVIDKIEAPPGSVKRRVPDTSKLKKLGFSPRIELHNGIKECLGFSL